MPVMPHTTTRRRRAGLLAGASLLSITALITPMATASAETLPSDTIKPDIVPALSGYNSLWQPSGDNDLHGTIRNAPALQHNDRVTSWINQHATHDQQFRALQNSAYLASDGSGYDQSISIADGLGKRLGAFYVKGRLDGSLPLTSALVNTSTGSTGAYISTSAAKAAYSHPRPFLPVDPNAAPVPGDTDGCAPSKINGSSLANNRKGKPWADSTGNLKITRVPATVDTTHEFATTDVPLDPIYGEAALCAGGSYPSGHTASAYEAGITLATLLPEVAPQILARSSEAGNNRIVLGVHYALDVVGGRMGGEIAVSARWSDAKFRSEVLAPARKELVSYLTAQCKAKLRISTLSKCIAADTSYVNNPYGGAKIPGGTAQIVTNRKSALEVYTERLGYGFKPIGSTKRVASVPAGAESLLRTTYPSLTAKQRRQILAQTQVASGHPLDTTAAHQTYELVPGSWQRLNLAAAMSAKVKVTKSGKVKVLSTGGKASVVR